MNDICVYVSTLLLHLLPTKQTTKLLNTYCDNAKIYDKYD